jgi:hypothetical protein
MINYISPNPSLPILISLKFRFSIMAHHLTNTQDGLEAVVRGITTENKDSFIGQNQ